MVYWVDVKAIHNNKWLIIRNKNYKYGLLRKDGSLLLPFNYFSISTSSIENEIIVVENEDGKEIVYSVIDDKIQLKD
jgi:hypothetical protein